MGECIVVEVMKLNALIKNVLSTEVHVYSKASKDLAKLFKRDTSGELLRQYILSSGNCMELLEIWKMRRGKPGMVYVFKLISAVLDHPFGKSRMSGIMRNLDSFARGIVLERLEDVYVEIKSEQVKRQNAALRLLASIVRRGMGLASDVEKTFDFNLSVLPKLSGNQRVKWKTCHETYSTRKSFVRFAMSFLEVGNPRLLGIIIRHKVLYAGVLLGLSKDDSDTIFYVLSILKDRVLPSSSLIRPGLRSLLFGEGTLEQLSLISGNPEGGHASDLAHEVLVMVCTDPCNGLMPNSNLMGNKKRLLKFMLKLKAIEVIYHKDLLLTVVKGKPFLCAKYLNKFPYNLDPSVSPEWFSAISLITDLISSTISSFSFNFLLSTSSHDPPDFKGKEMQYVLKSILPHPFTRSVCNKGLLHADILVKHGALRLLLEILKALDKFSIQIDLVAENSCSDQAGCFECVPADWNGSSGFEFFGNIFSYNFHSKSHTAPQNDPSLMQNWMSFKQDLQDEVGNFLPDLQVLLNLLASTQRMINLSSSLNNEGSCDSRFSFKRCHELPEVSRKRLKPNISSIGDSVDIIISGVNLENNYNTLEEDTDLKVSEDMILKETNVKMAVDELWGTSKADVIANTTKKLDIFFYTKLLDTLALYIRRVPKALGGSFDFFKILPDDPSSLSSFHQDSVLSLLVEYTGQSSLCSHPVRVPDMMYKHLLPLINLLSHTQGGSQDKAYALVRSAMLSTGAFDQNVSEIDAWLLFLPSHCRKENYASETNANNKWVTTVISFLCDAVSTVGNNLFKNWDHMRVLISHLKGFRDEPPTYSPLVPVIIEKCIRLLKSNSGSFKLYEKTMVSLYVCNSLIYLLQSQALPGSLPYLINLLLSEKSNCTYTMDDDSNTSHSEWKPIKSLLLSARCILRQQSCDHLFHIPERIKKGNDGLFYPVLNSVREVLASDHKLGLDEAAVSLLSSVICATLDEILNCFPLLVIVAEQLWGAHTQILSSILFCEWNVLSVVSDLCPDMPFSSLDDIEDTMNNNHEFATTAFSSIWEPIPFHSLFTLAMNLSRCNVVLSTKMLKLLKERLYSGDFRDSFPSSLRLVLSSAYNIRLFYKSNPSETLERLFQMCIVLIEHSIENILVVEHGIGILDNRGISDQTKFIQELLELIILHPVVTQCILNPLSCTSIVPKEKMFGNFENFIVLSKKTFHPFDSCILHIFKRVVDFLITPEGGQKSMCNIFSVPASVRRKIKNILHYCIDSYKKNFDLCVEMKDLVPFLPNFCIFYGLMDLISPNDLLEMVYWMLSKIDRHLIGWKFPRMSALSVALCIANNTFKLFSDVQFMNKSHFFWGGSADVTCVVPLKNLFAMILQFSTDFNLEFADMCLLKTVDLVYNQRFSRPTANFQFCMLMSRTLISRHVEIFRHCIYKPSKTKSALLFKLMEIIPLHSRFLGTILFDIIDKYPSSRVGVSISLKGTNTMTDSSHAFTTEDFILLLPSALSFHKTSLLSGRDQKMSFVIPTFYSRILLDSCSNWKNFFSTSLFHEDRTDLILKPSDFQFTFHNTLIGKAVCMLQSFFLLSPESITRKQRLKYFDSMYSTDDSFSGFDAMDNKKQPCGDLFNFVNRVIGKIAFSWLLLCPEEIFCEDLPLRCKEDARETSIRKESKRENHAKLKFMDYLTCFLDKIVRNTPFKQDFHNGPNSSIWFQLMRFLEVSILGSIVRLATKNNNFLTQSSSITFLEVFIKSSLLHRFDDPHTISEICNILNALKGRFNAVDVLELLLGHSKFVHVIHSGNSSPPSSGFVVTGTILQMLPNLFESISSSFGFGSLGSSQCFDFQNGEHFPENIKLQLVKLLRILYPLAVSHNDYSAVSMNKKELFSLLLSGYGASLSETDVETLQLILDIESIEKQSALTISSMDYLWGTSALQLQKEEKLDHLMNDNRYNDCETAQDKSRRIFRDNVLIDSRMCITTVLNFNLTYMSDTCSLQQSRRAHLGKMYDPSFMLRMSDNCLRKSFIDPLEFTQMGLLAYALINISSPNQDFRILGYEVLISFTKALMNQQKKNDLLQIQLLLTYLQNGITEPWQKIPSIIAIFAAEASFILLDSSHVHFQTIRNLLTESRKVDLKKIPLFDTFFKQSVKENFVNSKRVRLWILQLIYAGLNQDDDAQILMIGFVIEYLLIFYVSSLSDTESKSLVLQILRKSVKLHKLACRLVMDGGLISWLYSDLVMHGKRLFSDEKEVSIKQLEILLEVILEVLSLRTITEWLKNEALEQLSEVSSYLLNLLVSSLGFLKGNITLINSIFDVISSTLRISQKRKVYFSHFTLSIDTLFQCYKVMDKELKHTMFNETCELGLRTLLMSTPPSVIFSKDKAKLAKVVFQAIPYALISYSGKVHSCEQEPADSRNNESYPQKLLRWITASVIVGFMSNMKPETNLSSQRKKENLQTLVLNMIMGEMEDCESKDADFNVNKALSALILYLYQLLAMETSLLPSIVFALCLLFPNENQNTDVKDLLSGELCSKIRCPAEVNANWRWSFYGPWEDRTSEQTSLECVDEAQACQTLLLAFSNSL